MKLNEIKMLMEDHRKNITRDECIQYLKKHCSDALKTIGHPIVRGMSLRGSPWQIIAGEDGGRKSANTTNHYTVILDKVMPSQFPRRSKSIICASHEAWQYARGYGQLYAIFPENGVKIGVCPGEDMWDTRITFLDEDRGIETWSSTFDHADIPADYDAIVSTLKQIQTDMDEDSKYADTIIGRAAAKFNGDIEDEITRAFTKPFKVTTTAEPQVYDRGEHEVWISGKCIAIRWEEFESILEELTNEAD